MRSHPSITCFESKIRNVFSFQTKEKAYTGFIGSGDKVVWNESYVKWLEQKVQNFQNEKKALDQAAEALNNNAKKFDKMLVKLKKEVNKFHAARSPEKQLLIDFYYHIRNGDPVTPLHEIENGVGVFLQNRKKPRIRIKFEK